jgi:transcriptional regulator with XRE-family HTH domain
VQDEAIGRLIAEYRHKAGLTQRALGKLLDRPHSYVAYVETGQHRLDILELMAFAKALGFRASRFVEQVEKNLQARERER